MSKYILSKDEQEIFGFIKEYINKKSIVKIIELVDFINNRLRYNPNYNKNKIEVIVKSLIRNKIILIGTKLTREDILKIQVRKEIYNYIQENPGININEIKNEFNLGSNQVLWHLSALNKFEFIRMIKIGNQKALYSFDFDRNKEKLIFHLRNEKIQEIIRLLKNGNKPLKPTKISNTLNIHYNTVKKYLIILLEFDLIIKVNGNKMKRYKLNNTKYLNLEKLIERELIHG
jgi:predicted transcriptional regulator